MNVKLLLVPSSVPDSYNILGSQDGTEPHGLETANIVSFQTSLDFFLFPFWNPFKREFDICRIRFLIKCSSKRSVVIIWPTATGKSPLLDRLLRWVEFHILSSHTAREQ